MSSRTFSIRFALAPGDVTVITALLRDLHTCYPEHKLFLECGYADLLAYNPHARPASGVVQSYANAEHFPVDYGQGLSGKNGQKYRTIHFLRWLYEDFEQKTGLDVPTLVPHGDFHFGSDEAPRLIEERYWVIAPGGKTDALTKMWDPSRFQQVVARLNALGLHCVQIGGTQSGGPRGRRVESLNPRLYHVIDLVGKTSRRDLLRLIRDAEGVICGVSFPMHVAAALERPCVVLAGGREAWWWEAYVNENKGFATASGTLRMPHRYLHTIGLLDCVGHHGGCWKKDLHPSAKGGYCYKPVDGDKGGRVPLCMKMIDVDMVVDSVMSYYTDGSLPPITPKQTVRSAVITAPLPAVPAPAATVTLGALEGQPAKTVEIVRPAADSATFDSPTLGGKFTCFTLLYGDHLKMHQECLESFLKTAPVGRYELRVLSNELGRNSLIYVNNLVAAGKVTLHQQHRTNIGKYPAMRQAFHDDAHPITTPYVLWFDDDTIFDKNDDWMALLATQIVAEHPRGRRLFGPRRYWTSDQRHREFCQSGTWYRGRPFCDRGENEVPNGTTIFFASGSFWALATHVLYDQDIPDGRIEHNGGDIVIGAQVQQGGWKQSGFSNNKGVVRWSAYTRRGINTPEIGTAQWHRYKAATGAVR